MKNRPNANDSVENANAPASVLLADGEQMNNLYRFTDFRTFLRTHFEDKKKINKHWSYGRWSKKLGLKATASLTMIINGQRDPGPKVVEAFCRYFGFNSAPRPRTTWKVEHFAS